MAAVSAVMIAILVLMAGQAGQVSTTLSRASARASARAPALPPPPANVPDPHFVSAQLAAGTLLTAVPLPTGAEPASSPPPGSPALAHPGVVPGSPYLVDRSAWWTAPGSLPAVVAWLRAHAPPGADMAATGASFLHGVVEWQGVGWSFASQGPAVTWMQLAVMVAPDGPGMVGMRADAQVIWDPLRTRASLIPPDVDSITVTELPGSDGVTATSTTLAPPVTSTSGAVVARYVAVVDALPVDDVPILNCPAWTGLRFQVVLANRQGSAVASITGDAAQCGGYALSINGMRQSTVSDPNQTFLHMVASTLGVALTSSGAPRS